VLIEGDRERAGQLAESYAGRASDVFVEHAVVGWEQENRLDAILSRTAVPRVSVAYGDCSPRPCIPDEARAEFRRRFVQLIEIEYTFFDANLGSAAGHNRLLEGARSDFIMILNRTRWPRRIC